MPENYSDRQNATDSLDYLAAQRALYTKAKHWMNFLIISICVLVLISFAGIIFASDLSLYVALSSVILFVIEIMIISPKIEGLRKKAAKIQELFDCEVLLLDWNYVTLGEKPSNEDIRKHSKAYNAEHQSYKDLMDWYPIIDNEIPVSVARILCQRENLSWDIELRNNLLRTIVLTITVIFSLLFIFMLISDLSIRNAIGYVVFPLLPVFAFSIPYYQNNKSAIHNKNRLKTMLDAAWISVLSSPMDSEKLNLLGRDIQNEIFNNRKNNPLIFDRFYWFYKDNQEEGMSYSTEKLISDYRRAMT